MRRIGVLVGGGEAPGINPTLKALVYRAAASNLAVAGIFDGWEGLLGTPPPAVLSLEPPDVRTWDRDPGSHLGCSRINPFRVLRDGQKLDASAEVARNVALLGIDALVVIGGPDALSAAQRLSAQGVPLVGVPKSINKEVARTDYAVGFDSSMRTCADIIERSRTPAGSKRWVEVVEVFGRSAGHLALWSGLAGGAQVILIPEHRFRLQHLYNLIDERLNRDGGGVLRWPRYTTVVVAEGAAPVDGHEVTIDPAPDEFGRSRLGGIGALLAERIRQDTGNEAHAVSLGHPQRGGAPAPLDRIMGHLFGSAAVEACEARAFGQMVTAHGVAPACEIALTALSEVVTAKSMVDVERYYDTDRYFVRRSVLDTGTTLG